MISLYFFSELLPIEGEKCIFTLSASFSAKFEIKNMVTLIFNYSYCKIRLGMSQVFLEDINYNHGFVFRDKINIIIFIFINLKFHLKTYCFINNNFLYNRYLEKQYCFL